MKDDRQAFQEFTAAHGARLFRTAYFLAGGDWHLAEDLTQDTLVKVYLAWRRVSRVEHPAAYAQTVLTRTFISQRRRKRSTEQPIADPPDRVIEDVDSAVRLTLLAELANLSARDRAVVVLRYWEDLSVEDVAAVLNISSASVRTQSSRALGRLRLALGEVFPERLPG
ncbi:SigE family RNA polymerase sigma factor [Catenulispora rubra]|uniref:SigE family RNA polymerase sigma factor n=1 Tax=Catenulispora rubra TaxID=280293 RepID=UPI0018926B9F|nr:SigE family RNA polymerase sigma factor [Catenulispora rubra]